MSKHSPTTSRDQLVAYFENDYIVLVPADRLVGERARSLMFDRYPHLKPPDAVHLATALIANADELHTFDSRLLDLDGRLTKRDGTPLRICKPGMGVTALPLLEGIENKAKERDETPNEPDEAKINLARELDEEEQEQEAEGQPEGPVGTVPPGGTGA